jgi:hypothetical protein
MLSGKKVEGPEVDVRKSVRVMHRAFDLGVNMVDTLCFYHEGMSEPTVGKGVKGRRHKVWIQTKCQAYKELAKGETLADRFLVALKALNVEYVDAYLMHSLGLGTFQKVGERFVDEMQPFLRDGRIRFLGFSSHDSPANIATFIKSGMFQVMLVQYNLIERDKGRVIRLAHRAGMGTSAMGPVGGGRLAGQPEHLDEHFAQEGYGSPEIALNFVFANEGLDVAFSGMNTIEMVDENARIASRRQKLSSQECSRLTATFRRKARKAKLFCTGCRYCMPCPSGVAIPNNLDLLSNAQLYGAWEYARQEYMGLETEKKASNCKKCGKCLKKCPQKIAVIEYLEEVARVFEP